MVDCQGCWGAIASLALTGVPDNQRFSTGWEKVEWRGRKERDESRLYIETCASAGRSYFELSFPLTSFSREFLRPFEVVDRLRCSLIPGH